MCSSESARLAPIPLAKPYVVRRLAAHCELKYELQVVTEVRPKDRAFARGLGPPLRSERDPEVRFHFQWRDLGARRDPVDQRSILAGLHSHATDRESAPVGQRERDRQPD